MVSKTKPQPSFDSYLERVRAFPLVSIRNMRHLHEAQQVVDSLLTGGPLDEGEELYLEALSDLIALYESQHVPISAPDDVELLKHLMDSQPISQRQLALATGIQKSTISEILSRKRKLTRAQIARLADHFGVEQGAFRYT